MRFLSTGRTMISHKDDEILEADVDSIPLLPDTDVIEKHYLRNDDFNFVQLRYDPDDETFRLAINYSYYHEGGGRSCKFSKTRPGWKRNTREIIIRKEDDDTLEAEITSQSYVTWTIPNTEEALVEEISEGDVYEWLHNGDLPESW